MTVDLRPRGLGEILDRTFQIYRSRFMVFLGIAALPALAMMALHLIDYSTIHVQTRLHPFRQPGIFLWNAAVYLGFYHIQALIVSLLIPAFVHQTSGTVFEQEGSLLGSLRFAVSRWRSYLWIGFLKLVAILIVPEILIVGIAFGLSYFGDLAGAGETFISILLIVLFPLAGGMVLFIWLGSCFSLTVPAAAMEQLKGVRAMRRSWNLSRESRFRLAAVWLMVFLSGWILSLAFQMTLRWALIYLYWNAHLRLPPFVYAGIAYGCYAALSTVFAPIYSIAVTLIYYDQRIRREGFDIEWLMNAAGMNPTPTPQEAELPVEAAEAREAPA